MISYYEEKAQFITLLAYANCSILPLALMQEINSALVLTDTQQETSTAISNKIFNLIIVDIDLNGFDLASTAKTVGCINYHTPIIALVNPGDDEKNRALIAAGFDDCLFKPLNVEDFNELIAFWQENNALSEYIESIKILLTTFKDNKNVVLTLYNKLYEELPQQINQIRIGLKTQEYQLVLDAAHSINGFAKICRLKSFDDLTIALKECIHQKKYDHADGYFAMLEHNHHNLVHYRQVILKQLAE